MRAAHLQPARFESAGAFSILVVREASKAAFNRATQWFNSPRLTAADLQGKILLVNFCTYKLPWLAVIPLAGSAELRGGERAKLGRNLSRCEIVFCLE